MATRGVGFVGRLWPILVGAALAACGGGSPAGSPGADSGPPGPADTAADTRPDGGAGGDAGVAVPDARPDGLPRDAARDAPSDAPLDVRPDADAGPETAPDVAPDTAGDAGPDGAHPCATDCDDGWECTIDICNPATGDCEHSWYPYGPCLDDSACTDDANECTQPVCEAPPGSPCAVCTFRVREGACDDGDPCTRDDRCVAVAPPRFAVCLGSPDDCDDGDPCTVDSCDPDTGACVHSASPECGCRSDDDCPDDPAVCAVGVCDRPAGAAFGACALVPDAAACDDGDPDTFDGCDPLARPRCWHLPSDRLTPCPCGPGDCPPDVGCVRFVCDEAAGDPRCRPQVRAGACDDGDPFDGPDTCVAGVCLPAYEGWAASMAPCVTAQDCLMALGPPANGCQQWLCPLGYCRQVRVPDETSCEDGRFCTVADTCREGVCVGGAARDCDDGGLVPGDWCDEHADECRRAEDYPCGGPCGADGDCDDGDPCTADSCALAATPTVCVCAPRPGCACDPAGPGGGAPACDDLDDTTRDWCAPNADPAVPHAGLCAHGPVRCCATWCFDPLDAAACDDGDPATDDRCAPYDEAAGSFCCENEPAAAR